MLDRMALLMPDWKERHVPDVGIALVELLAYTGDHLSYYQDAVATEAYLDTARQRVSVRRHAHLVDYRMHEGNNARAWVFLHTDRDRKLDPKNIYLITGQLLELEGRVLSEDDLNNITPSQYEVFEPLVEDQDIPIKLHLAHNQIPFYTWGDSECCLPKGATQVTLKDAWKSPPEPEPSPDKPKPEQQNDISTHAASAKVVMERERALNLQLGDVLIFEEVIGPRTGNAADADPTHRHAVRLTRVSPSVDPLYDQPVVEIEWSEADALPFPLCISTTSDPPECEPLENVSIARGNIILVDHGRRIGPEDLGCVPLERTEEECPHPCRPPEIRLLPGDYRPVLVGTDLTFSQPLTPGAPASAVLVQVPRSALPWIQLNSAPDPECKAAEPEEEPPDEPLAIEAEYQTTEQAKQEPPVDHPQPEPDPPPVSNWLPQLDLLSSYPGDRHFVVEMDNERGAHLRFGDGELGRLPEAETKFKTIYRMGNGPVGNVGAEVITHIVFRQFVSGIELQPRNPMPASGGTAPEPIENVKLFAPHTFRRRLERAITANDYAEIVMRDFENRVQRAATTLRWVGSWYEVTVAIDPRGTETAGQALLTEITGHLYRYRRIGHDLVIKPAQYVPLEIELIVCVLPDYLRGHVKSELLEVFSNRQLLDGRIGFFHPDNLTFGGGVYLSNLVAAAQVVPGVESVTVRRLERQFEGPNGEIENGLLTLGPLEVARLDNDPNLPENGVMVIEMRGGR
jgi:hypothetical protein